MTVLPARLGDRAGAFGAARQGMAVAGYGPVYSLESTLGRLRHTNPNTNTNTNPNPIRMPSESPAQQFLSRSRELVDAVEAQLPAIEQAAEWFAESILAGRVVHVFGSGHSRIMVEEMWPRYGSFPGFNPIVELSLDASTTSSSAPTDSGRRCSSRTCRGWPSAS